MRKAFRDLPSILIFLFLSLPVFSGELSSHPFDIRLLMQKGVGYASVFNYEKTAEICDELVSLSQNSEVVARAHWLKAAAFAMYQLQYRSRELDEELKREVAMVAKLRPDLMEEVLARHQACLPFFKPGFVDVQDLLQKATSKYESSATTHALSAYKLGQACFAAGERKFQVPVEQREQLKKAAARYFEIASRLKPENYEFAVYHMTALHQLKQFGEVRELGRRLVERFLNRPSFAFHRDPAYYYAVVTSKTDEEKAREILEERASSPEAGAGIHLYLAQVKMKQAATPIEKIQILSEFISSVEEGEISSSGYNMHELVAAYYKLAHQQYEQGFFDSALSTYKKIARYSPHYADIHYKRGLLYKAMAEEEPDPEKKKTLLENAKKELEIQTSYNWQGWAAAKAKRALAELKE